MIQTLAQTTRTAPDYDAEISPAPASTASPAPVTQGPKSWLSTLVVLIALPLLSLATTKYVLLPSMSQALAPTTRYSKDWGTPHVFMAKIPFNISGFRSLALLGANSSFKHTIDQNKARLTDLAAADLDGLTPSDLYKPGVLDDVRAKLCADFNRALGGKVVKQVFIAVYPDK